MQRIFIGLHDQLKDSDTRFYIITDSVFGASYALIHMASRPRLPDLTSESMNGRVQMRLGDLTRWSIVHQENQRFFKMSGFAACHLNAADTYLNVSIPLCFVGRETYRRYYTDLGAKMSNFWTVFQDAQSTDQKRREALVRLREIYPPDISLPADEAERVYFLSYGLLTLPSSFIQKAANTEDIGTQFFPTDALQKPKDASTNTVPSMNLCPPPTNANHPDFPLLDIPIPDIPLPANPTASTSHFSTPFSELQGPLSNDVEPPFQPLPDYLCSDRTLFSPNPPGLTQAPLDTPSTSNGLMRMVTPPPLEPPPPPRPSTPSFDCPICDEKKTSDESLRRHFVKHVENADSRTCHSCLNFFPTSSLMFDHFIEQHGNLPKYQCLHCPKTFYLRSQYNRHLANQHATDAIDLSDD